MTKPKEDNSSGPLISVVIATRNCGKTLQRCLDAFASQTYKNKEMVLFDCLSTDSTLDIIERNASALAYWKSEPDTGIYNAWNKSLKHVKGDWIYFMGGDDYFWAADVLEKMSRVLSWAYPSYRVVYGRVNVLKPDGSVIMTAGVDWDRKKFRQVMSIPHQGVFHHRSLFGIHGVFDETFPIAGDYEMLLREFMVGAPLFVQNVIVTAMGFGGCSSNYAHSLRALNDIYRVRRKHRIPDFPGLFLWIYFKALVRRVISITMGEACATHVGNFYRNITGRNSV